MNTIEIGTKVNLYLNDIDNAVNNKASFKDAEIVKKLSYDRVQVQAILIEGTEVRVGWQYNMDYKTEFGTMQAKAVMMAYDFDENTANLELRLLSDFEPYEIRRNYRYVMKKKFVADVLDSKGNKTDETLNLNMVDISCSGFRAISDRSIDPKTILHFSLSFNKDNNFEFLTEVLVSKRARNYEDKYELRCRFLNSKLEDELNLLKVIFDMASE